MRTALVGITLITVAVYMVYPWSETSAGGNYNLHFLSPEMRRALRPAIGQEYFSTTDNLIKRNGGKDHFLRQNEPLSIYMPAVGFLWTDNMVWDEEIGIFVEESFAKQQEMQNIASKGVSSDSLADFPGSRAIFKDHINSVGPSSLSETERVFRGRNNYHGSSLVFYLKMMIDLLLIALSWMGILYISD